MPAEAANGRRTRKRRTPLLEWISAAIGLAITIGILGYLGMQLRSQRQAVPALSAVVERIVPAPAGHLVEITVRNASPSTAAHVQVEGTLTHGQEATRSLALIDYVPAHSRRGAGLHFDTDPADGELEVRVIGYTEP